jgi:endonuclease/exonuclease/phosphatase family metal-dependent hydrolase
MKKLVLISVLTWSCFAAGAQRKYRVIAIGFYNCENFFHPENDSTKEDDDFTPTGDYRYTEEVYRQKLHNIATVFQKLGTDITPDGVALAGLVEVESDKVLNDLVQQPEIKDRNYKYVWFPTPDVRGISTAMLYNPRYFRVLNARPLHVPLDSIGQKRPTRDILYVQGILAGNDTVNILVNHWPSRSSGEAETRPYRALAASVDRALADSLFQVNPETKLLIMGDLNDNPTDASVIKVLRARADSSNLSLTDIYNPWINIFKRGSGTEAYQGQWNLLDQIMVSGAFFQNNNNKWRFYKPQIFNKDFLTNMQGTDQGFPHRSFDVNHNWDNGFSDHYPVLVYLIQ